MAAAQKVTAQVNETHLTMTDDPRQLPMPLPDMPQCPICHAPLKAGQRVCWLCQQAIDRSGASAHGPLLPPSLNVPPPLPPPPPDYSFSLSTLMLAMTLIAVLAGLCKIAPGIGVPVAVIALFAWIHTVQETRRMSVSSPRLKLLKFFEAFGLLTVLLLAGVGAIAAASFTAFAAICDPMSGPNGRPVNYANVFYGAAAAVLCFFFARFIHKVFERNRPRDRFGNRL